VVEEGAAEEGSIVIKIITVIVIVINKKGVVDRNIDRLK
jgi:hypothetical protein